jgi:hypothetical protein
MSRSLVALWVLGTILAGGALGVSGTRYWDARARAQSELATLSLAHRPGCAKAVRPRA